MRESGVSNLFLLMSTMLLLLFSCGQQEAILSFFLYLFCGVSSNIVTSSIITERIKSYDFITRNINHNRNIYIKKILIKCLLNYSM